jgi:hypothetical protein
MKTLMLAAVMSVGAFLVGCATSANAGAQGQAGGNGDADAAIRSYVNGSKKAPAFIPVHEFVFVGQTWVLEVDVNGEMQTETWQIVSTAARGVVVIEQILPQGYVLAYQVNAWADEGKPNVQKAWVGKAGETGRAIQVQSSIESEDEPGFVMRANFRNVELAGKTWAGELVTVREDGHSSRTWIANDGWFNGIIRKDVNDRTVLRLKETRTTARIRPSLKVE